MSPSRMSPSRISPSVVRTFAALAASALMCVVGTRPAQSQEALQVYLIDVEGGGATLFVSPSSESLLVDTGNGGAAAERDAGRIVDAMRDAGVSQIDHLITTHWHGDHYGAMAALAARVPIRHFIDHGPTVETSETALNFLANIYPTLLQGAEHTVVEPGDEIQFSGLDVTVLTSAKRVTDRAVAGGGQPNPYCDAFVPQEEDLGENAQSVGIVLDFGDLRILHLGDLTWNTEFELMCPNNPIGPVDLFVVSHHGQPISNSAVLVHAVEPRVAIMNNGTRKGGQPEAMRILHSAPGLEDLWQLHFSELSGQEHTVPGLFIVNPTDDAPAAMPIAPFVAGGGDAPPRPVHDGEAYWLKVVGQTDGSFTVTNARNGFGKSYR